MNLVDQYRLLVSGYYGIREIDDYNLKEYVLKDVENYIKDFIRLYPIEDYDYQKEAEELENSDIKTKLQDALLVLNKINGSIELILLIKKRINEINEQEMLEI